MSYNSGGIWNSPIIFNNITFNKGIEFKYYSFDNNVSFINCIFVEAVIFGKSILKKDVSFVNCIFKSNTNFWGTTFSSKSVFLNQDLKVLIIIFGRVIFMEMFFVRILM